jgi:hypothetical protein
MYLFEWGCGVRRVEACCARGACEEVQWDVGDEDEKGGILGLSATRRGVGSTLICAFLVIVLSHITA